MIGPIERTKRITAYAAPFIDAPSPAMFWNTKVPRIGKPADEP
jgi:hypothetical protein